MNFYKHFMGDYAKKTSRLTLAQHGAYHMLIDAYYSEEKPLPADYDELYRIARAMDAKERDAVRTVADKHFPITADGFRHNERCDEEITAYQAQAETNRLIAVAREAKRKEHEQSTNRATNGCTKQEPSQSQSQKELKDIPTATAVGAAGAAIPDCPHEKIIELYHTQLPECPKVLQWHDTRQGYLRSRWKQMAKANGVTPGYATEEAGLAWWRKFFGYCAQSDFLTGKGTGRDGKPPFSADLEWVIRPTNFAKIIEGRYHR